MLRNAVSTLGDGAQRTLKTPLSFAQAAAARGTVGANPPARWNQLAVQGGSRRRAMLPDELKACLERGEQRMARFHRTAPAQRTRKVIVVYFKRQVVGNPRLMRFKIERLVAPIDRGAVVFVDFIGQSVVEVLLDTEYKVDVLEALRLLKYRHIRKATLLTGSAIKYKHLSPANYLLFNSAKLLTRTENILLRIDHPVARSFYDGLNIIAKANVLKARSDGADVPDSELFPARRQPEKPARPEPRNNGTTTHPTSTNGGAG